MQASEKQPSAGGNYVLCPQDISPVCGGMRAPKHPPVLVVVVAVVLLQLLLLQKWKTAKIPCHSCYCCSCCCCCCEAGRCSVSSNWARSLVQNVTTAAGA